MRVGVEGRQIESTFTGKRERMQIAATAEAYRILSSNLYKDKPLAIIRELSCNALDSHRQAGQKAPFKIIMPSKLNPTLYIRDFGTGMPHEKIIGLFNTIFGSDKNHADLDIGGFGLGSKTPYSYADTFTMVGRYNGKKHTYLCYMDEENIPGIELVSVEDTDEGNGIEYAIPVKTEDFSVFREKTSEALRYFPEDSYETTVDIEKIKYSVKTDLYGIRDNSQTYNRYRADREQRLIMGPVAYEFDSEVLEKRIQDKYSVLFNKPFDFFCEIGDVDIQPSREALSYDKKSQQQIVKVLQKVMDTVKHDIEETIKAETTYVDACIKAKETLTHFPDSMRKGIKWRGYTITPNSVFETPMRSAKVDSGDVTANDALRVKWNSRMYVNITDMNECVFCYYDPTVPHNSARIKLFLEKNTDTILLFKNEQEMYNVMAEFQILENTSTADMPLPPKVITEKNTVAKTAPVKLRILHAGNYSFTPLVKEFDVINELENGSYTMLHGNGDRPFADSDEEEKVQILDRFGIKFDIVGVPKTLQHKVKFITLPTFDQYFRAKMIELIDNEDLYSRAILEETKITCFSDLKNYTPKCWFDLEFYQEIEKYKDVRINSIMQYRERLERLLGWDTKIVRTSRIHELYREHYTHLRHLDRIYSDEEFFIHETLLMVHGAMQWRS